MSNTPEHPNVQDHGPEVVRESYHPTLEAVIHSTPTEKYGSARSPIPVSHSLFPNDKSYSDRGAVTPPAISTEQSSYDPINEKIITEPSQKLQRLPFGLSTFAFGFLIALITAIIVGGAVGGGIGAVVANKNEDLDNANAALADARRTIDSYASLNATSSTNASTPTNTTNTITNNTITSNSSFVTVDLLNYTVADPHTVTNLSSPCTGIGAKLKTYTSSRNEVYNSICNAAFKSGLAALQGGVVADLSHLVAYTVEDCMEACSGFNYEQKKWNNTQICRAYNFRLNMAEKVNAIGGNCWLKNDTVADADAAPVEEGVISGSIIG